MSENQNVDAARQYHSGTKHSYLSIRMHPHALDWENRPLLFKIYPTLEVTRLPRDFQQTGRPALSAIADVGTNSEKESDSRSRNARTTPFLLSRSDPQQETPSGRNLLPCSVLHRGALRDRTLCGVLRFTGQRSEALGRLLLCPQGYITLEPQSSDCGNFAPETIANS